VRPLAVLAERFTVIGDDDDRGGRVEAEVPEAIQKGPASLALRNADGTPKWTPATDVGDGCGVNDSPLPVGTERWDRRGKTAACHLRATGSDRTSVTVLRCRSHAFTAAGAKAVAPDVEILENGANLGFAKACNVGARHARAPLLFFFNPDAIALPGLLQEAVLYFSAHPDVAMAGVKLLNDDGTVAESCGQFDTWWQAFLRSSAWGELPFFRKQANAYALRRWDYSTERDVDLVVVQAVAHPVTEPDRARPVEAFSKQPATSRRPGGRPETCPSRSTTSCRLGANRCWNTADSAYADSAIKDGAGGTRRGRGRRSRAAWPVPRARMPGMADHPE